MLPTATMETEASQMLEAALEQMDDIIAGKSEEVAVWSLWHGSYSKYVVFFSANRQRWS